jgi:EmrB/QacA subfamily drug resistance transporter
MIMRMKPTHRLTLLATIFGSGIVFLDGTVVNLALPSIAKDLGASFAQLQWIADGYLLSLSSLILLGGSLGDILGRKKVFLYGLYGFGLFSLLCGVAANSEALIIFRILQGLFGALLVPGSLAIINTNFPQKSRGRAIGLWSAWAGAFTALGPLVGGYLIDAASWRWIFYINVPLILICIVLTIFGVKETRDKGRRKIDYAGAVTAALALAGITYGLIEGPANHWHPVSVLPFFAGLLFANIFSIIERGKRDPMVPFSLFKSRNFAGANLMTFAMYGALSGFMFALVIYLQTKMHYSAIKAGLCLLPVTILMLGLSGRMGELSGKLGPRRFMTAGPVLAGFGILLLTGLKPGDGYFTYLLPCVFIFGLGLVTTVAPLTTTVMTSVPGEDSGVASAINNAVSRVGGLVVIALLGLLGAEHVFKFSMILCGLLVISAGVISYKTIVDSKKVVAKADN